MHLLATVSRSLDDLSAAVDLDQTPADWLFLSFSDSDLTALAAAYADGPARVAGRLAPLAQLRHPYSVDLYLEKTARHAKVILVRLLGGLDYWRYGAEELAQMARRQGIALAILPGDAIADPRLTALSTVPPTVTARLWDYFQTGGPVNMEQVLDWIDAGCRGETLPLLPPAPLPDFGRFDPACHPAPPGAARAALVFYRSHAMAGDTQPILALAAALAHRGFGVETLFVSSLKAPEAAAALRHHLTESAPAIILNATNFSARQGADGSPLDAAGVPVLQVILANGSRDAWAAGGQGVSATDLVMSIVLPELDGRIGTTALAFKNLTERVAGLEFAPARLIADPDQTAHIADLAAAWVRLARAPRADRRIGIILSDYPGKLGREAYAVGLDTPESLRQIVRLLGASGYTIGPLPGALMAALTAPAPDENLSAAAYRAAFTALPAGFRAQVEAAWGPPPPDGFRFRHLTTGHLTIALQPDRGRAETRQQRYHDGTEPPSHAYIAFYLWLRGRVDALVHLGTHGTLEWLPGKAAALGPDCAPRAVLGAVPVIYPFIVNNPGEAAQAKRRTSAVTLGHLTPPLVAAGSPGGIEALLDEYAAAVSLDPKRAGLLAQAILDDARTTGLAADCGVTDDLSAEEALTRLDNFLCDVKEMRIADGLHIFGAAPDPTLWPEVPDAARPALLASGAAEKAALLAALDGRFIPPAPAGAPARGRVDVFPTGRNLTALDPRQVPTRTAWTLGQRAADALIARYLQDHGDWPKSILLDLWGSATLRTGGEDFAQAIALLGAQPEWEEASGRLIGVTILPPAVLDRPRIDVTLRISGLFRDVFPQQIAIFADLVAQIAARDEAPALNPLTAAEGPQDRIFGAAPGAYGTGVLRHWQAEDAEADALGETYLAATSHAYGIAAPRPSGAFADRVRAADAYIHTQDLPGQDLLDSDAFADHEGGFAAANAALGGRAALYHLDTTTPDRPVPRSLREEVARVLRGRLTNPRWLAGQRRHGHRGAAEIAESIDNLIAFARLTDAVRSDQIDRAYDATLGDTDLARFLETENPGAAEALRRAFTRAQRLGLWHPRRNATLGDPL